MNAAERAVIEWQPHWKTWALNKGYYGVWEDTDRHRTCWSVEWCPSRAVAQRIQARTAAIDAAVEAHQPADAHGNRRVRLDVRPCAEGFLVREYDFSRWTVTIP